MCPFEPTTNKYLKLPKVGASYDFSQHGKIMEITKIDNPEHKLSRFNFMQKGVEKLTDKDKHSLLLQFDKVLWLNLGKLKKEKTKIPVEVKRLAEQRLTARQNKDWKKADELREKIKELGYAVGDTKDGYEIKKE